MGIRFPVTTSKVFGEWLVLWGRFYRQVFSLRYNLQPLRKLGLPSGDFCWPIVVGGRDGITPQSLLCKNGCPPKKGVKLVIDQNVRKAIADAQLVSLRQSGERPYVVWVRDPCQPHNCLIGVDCQRLSRRHNTTTLEEELLLRLFIRFYGEQTFEEPAVLLCADSWIEGQSRMIQSGKLLWPAIQRFLAFTKTNKVGSSRLISVAPRIIGAAREVFIP